MTYLKQEKQNEMNEVENLDNWKNYKQYNYFEKQKKFFDLDYHFLKNIENKTD